jgi:hypothetical protein
MDIEEIEKHSLPRCKRTPASSKFQKIDSSSQKAGKADSITAVVIMDAWQRDLLIFQHAVATPTSLFQGPTRRQTRNEKTRVPRMPTLWGERAWDSCVYNELRRKRIKVKDNMTIKGGRKVLQMDTSGTQTTDVQHLQSEATPTLAIAAKILSEPNVITGPTDSSRDAAKEVLSHK